MRATGTPAGLGPSSIRLRTAAAATRHGLRVQNLRGRALHARAQREEFQTVAIPGSQEEAVRQAAASLKLQVQPLLSSAKPKATKGFGGGGGGAGGDAAGNRLSIELPVADTSPAATARLVREVLSLAGLATGGKGGCVVVCASAEAAKAAAVALGGGTQVLELRAACQTDALAGPLLLVAPSIADVALVEQLLEEVWAGPAAVALNPGWAEAGAEAALPGEFAALAASFQPVYSFLPISVKGLVGNKEGAVLRWVRGAGSLASTPWQILLQQGEQFVQVGQTKARPKQADMELVIMNASAAASPLASAAKGLRSLVDALQPKGKAGADKQQ